MTDNYDTPTLREYNRKHVWHPFTQMSEWEESEPIIIVDGDGCWLVDSEGNRFLDGVGSIWTNVHGHAVPEINEAIRSQIDRIEHSTLLGLTNDKAALLAKRLVDIAPQGLTKVFYSDNGSTAVEIGLKMAFQYWQHKGKPEKTRFISFRNAYHGDTLGAVSVGGIDTFHAIFNPLLFKAVHAPSPNCYRCELCSVRDASLCNRECLQELERLISIHAHELAGLIIEPIVQGAGGMIVQPYGFVKRVRELCDSYGILMIADEVAVGFGRTGTMFASQQESVTPDIMALSKGITGGYLPLAATLATQEVYGAFLGEYRDLKTFFHGHTFTGNPVCCAAALASLDLFGKNHLLEALPQKIEYLSERIKKLLEFEHVGDVRQCGMIGGIELVRNKVTREPYSWEERIGIQVCQEAIKFGVFLRPLGNVIVIFPPLAISLKELELLMDVIERSIENICGS